MRLVRPTLAALACIACVVVIGMKVGDPPGAQMKSFADAFIASLDKEQQAAALAPYDSPTRVDWHFIPKESRKGLVMREMNSAQRAAALRLVRAGLSEVGYDKANKIMMLEDVLRKLEGEGRTWERDPQKYYVTIFGTPSETDVWGLSFEGHHLSLNFVCRGGKVVDSTPQFFAANPATIMNEVEGPLGKGTRVLRQEEELAFELVNALSDDQRSKAVLSDTALKEIRFAGEPQANVGQPEGIPQSELNNDQKKMLKDLVYVYANNVADEIAQKRRNMIDDNGWANIHFAWSGATEPGLGHYYRVQGKDFLIEFVNTQPDAAGNPANHIHSVWRDLTGDFDLPAK